MLAIARRARPCWRSHSRVPKLRACQERHAEGRADAAAMERLLQEYMWTPRADAHRNRPRRRGSSAKNRMDGRTTYPHDHTRYANACTHARGTSCRAVEAEPASLWLTQCVSASEQRPALTACWMQRGFLIAYSLSARSPHTGNAEAGRWVRGRHSKSVIEACAALRRLQAETSP